MAQGHWQGSPGGKVTMRNGRSKHTQYCQEGPMVGSAHPGHADPHRVAARWLRGGRSGHCRHSDQCEEQGGSTTLLVVFLAGVVAALSEVGVLVTLCGAVACCLPAVTGWSWRQARDARVPLALAPAPWPEPATVGRLAVRATAVLAAASASAGMMVLAIANQRSVDYDCPDFSVEAPVREWWLDPTGTVVFGRARHRGSLRHTGPPVHHGRPRRRRGYPRRVALRRGGHVQRQQGGHRDRAGRRGRGRERDVLRCLAQGYDNGEMPRTSASPCAPSTATWRTCGEARSPPALRAHPVRSRPAERVNVRFGLTRIGPQTSSCSAGDAKITIYTVVLASSRPGLVTYSG